METSKFKNGRPLHERVIIKKEKAQTFTEGGIFLPEEARDSINIGTVVAMGNLVNNEGEGINEGDKVMIQKFAGLPMVIDGVEYTMVMKNDIIFVFDE